MMSISRIKSSECNYLLAIKLLSKNLLNENCYILREKQKIKRRAFVVDLSGASDE
jgi:hypothetical protein